MPGSGSGTPSSAGSITLIATAAGANSNTYCTLLEAETYFTSRGFKSDWTSETDANKNIVLAWCTRLIDEQMAWDGSKYSSVQALRWPRNGVATPDYETLANNTIPQFLKDAVAEYARYQIIKDRQADPATLGFREMSLVYGMFVKIDRYDRLKALPPSVWSMIQFYGIKASGKSRQLILS